MKIEKYRGFCVYRIIGPTRYLIWSPVIVQAGTVVVVIVVVVFT